MSWLQIGHDSSNTNKTDVIPISYQRINGLEYSFPYDFKSAADIVQDINENLLCIEATALKCRDITNGDLLWSYTLQDHTSRSVAAVLSTGNIVILDSVGGSPDYGCVRCLDSNGNLLWTYTDNFYIRWNGSPIKVDGNDNIYFFACDTIDLYPGHLYCISSAGTFIWKNSLYYTDPERYAFFIGGSGNWPVIDSNGNVYVTWREYPVYVPGHYYTKKIGPTGVDVWDATKVLFGNFLTLSTDESLLFATLETSGDEPACALNTSDGSVAWETSISGSNRLVARDDDDNTYYANTYSVDRYLVSLDKYGDERWRTSLYPGFTWAVVAGDGNIYLSRETGLSIYMCSDGTLVDSYSASLWYFKPLLTPDRILVQNYERTYINSYAFLFRISSVEPTEKQMIEKDTPITVTFNSDIDQDTIDGAAIVESAINYQKIDYNWRDPDGEKTDLSFSDPDYGYASIDLTALGFNLVFGGLVQTKLYVSVDGNMGFTYGFEWDEGFWYGNGWPNFFLPFDDLLDELTIIAPFWLDLLIGEDTLVFYFINASNELVITFENIHVNYASGDDTIITFQIVFPESSDQFIVNYKDAAVDDEWFSKGANQTTIGFQLDGTEKGYTFAYNAGVGVVTNQFALQFDTSDVVFTSRTFSYLCNGETLTISPPEGETWDVENLKITFTSDLKDTFGVSLGDVPVSYRWAVIRSLLGIAQCKATNVFLDARTGRVIRFAKIS